MSALLHHKNLISANAIQNTMYKIDILNAKLTCLLFTEQIESLYAWLRENKAVTSPDANDLIAIKQELNRVKTELNKQPRKTLGYKTPIGNIQYC